MRISDAEVTAAIVAVFSARAQLSGIHSPTGGQLQRAKLGLIGGTHPPDRTADRLATLADVTRAFDGLTSDELTALRLRYWYRRGQEVRTRRNTRGVLLDYRISHRPSERFCGRCMGLTTSQYNRLKRRARSRVRENLERLRSL